MTSPRDSLTAPTTQTHVWFSPAVQTDSSSLLQQFVFGALCFLVREEESTPQGLYSDSFSRQTLAVCLSEVLTNRPAVLRQKCIVLFPSVWEPRKRGFAIRIFSCSSSRSGFMSVHSGSLLCGSSFFFFFLGLYLYYAI